MCEEIISIAPEMNKIGYLWSSTPHDQLGCPRLLPEGMRFAVNNFLREKEAVSKLLVEEEIKFQIFRNTVLELF